MKSFTDYYALLGIEPTATEQEIKTAHKKQMHECHPDRHGGASHAEDRARLLNEAKQVLLHPEKRRIHDEARNEHLRRTPLADVFAKLATTKNALRGTVPPTLVPRPSPSPSFGFGGFLGIMALVAGGAAVLSRMNSYDSSADRYRGRDGRFKRGRFS